MDYFIFIALNILYVLSIINGINITKTYKKITALEDRLKKLEIKLDVKNFNNINEK